MYIARTPEEPVANTSWHHKELLAIFWYPSIILCMAIIDRPYAPPQSLSTRSVPKLRLSATRPGCVTWCLLDEGYWQVLTMPAVCVLLEVLNYIVNVDTKCECVSDGCVLDKWITIFAMRHKWVLLCWPITTVMLRNTQRVISQRDTN